MFIQDRANPDKETRNIHRPPCDRCQNTHGRRRGITDVSQFLPRHTGLIRKISHHRPNKKWRKIIAEKEYQIALDKGDIKTARSKAQQTGKLSKEMIQQTKELLSALGIPFVQAPSEGEAQACHMVKKGDAYAVGSQDYDCLLVGSPVLVRNLTSSGKPSQLTGLC